jgi:hypothetical protein
MPDYRRTGYAPWSLTREAGVQSATVDGTIEVDQYLQPTIDTGYVDFKGNWKGRRSDDEQFIGLTKFEAIANGTSVLGPDTSNIPSIDMTGYTDLVIAMKPTNGGSFGYVAVSGPDTQPYANLSPINPNQTIRIIPEYSSDNFVDAMSDSYSQNADVWTIFHVLDRLRGQKNLQIRITNNSGGESDIEFGFMRLV